MKPGLVLLLALLIGGGFFAAGVLWQRDQESDASAAPADPATPESPPPVALVDVDALPEVRAAERFAEISPSITTPAAWHELMVELSFGPMFGLLRKGTGLDPRPALDARPVNPRALTLTESEQADLDEALADLEEEIRRVRITRELLRFRAFRARAAVEPKIVPPAQGLTPEDVEHGRTNAAEQEQKLLQRILVELQRAAGGAENLDYLTVTPFVPRAQRPSKMDFLARAEMQGRLGSAVHWITRADWPEPFAAGDLLEARKEERIAAMAEFIAGLKR